MKDWQNRMISASERPLGSKSAPPLPPPMGMPVRAFLKICSKPRNFTIPRLTEVEAQAALVGAERAGELDPETAVDVDVAGVVGPRHPEDQLALGLTYPLDDAGVHELGALRQHRTEGLQDLADRLVELLLALVAPQDLDVERFDDPVRGLVRAGGIGGVGNDRHLIKTFRGGLVRVGTPVPEGATVVRPDCPVPPDDLRHPST